MFRPFLNQKTLFLWRSMLKSLQVEERKRNSFLFIKLAQVLPQATAEMIDIKRFSAEKTQRLSKLTCSVQEIKAME